MLLNRKLAKQYVVQPIFFLNYYYLKLFIHDALLCYIINNTMNETIELKKNIERMAEAYVLLLKRVEMLEENLNRLTSKEKVRDECSVYKMRILRKVEGGGV